jgi:hypothetical protein
MSESLRTGLDGPLRTTRLRDRPRIELPSCSLVIDPSPLLGEWINYDQQTRNILRLTLASSGGRVTVRVLGAALPEPIDWGETAAEPFAGAVDSEEAVGFKAFYDVGFLRTMLVSYLNKRLLVVDAYTVFHDGSGRSSYFARDHFYL